MTMMGAINYNAVITGVYITNGPDACLYQATHSNAEVVVCDTIERLRGFAVNMDKLTNVKAYILWGNEELPPDCRGPKFFLWRDFLKTGNHINDEVIYSKMRE